jgi:hypothetical protein
VGENLRGLIKSHIFLLQLAMSNTVVVPLELLPKEALRILSLHSLLEPPQIYYHSKVVNRELAITLTKNHF